MTSDLSIQLASIFDSSEIYVFALRILCWSLVARLLFSQTTDLLYLTDDVYVIRWKVWRDSWGTLVTHYWLSSNRKLDCILVRFVVVDRTESGY